MVVNQPQAVVQPVSVGARRQQAVAQNAQPFRKKPAVGQDAAVGKKGQQLAAGKQRQQTLAKRLAQCRVGFQRVQHGLIARQISLIAAPLWAQTIHQLTRQVQGVGARVMKTRQHGRQAAGGAALGAQPVGQCGEPCSHENSLPRFAARLA